MHHLSTDFYNSNSMQTRIKRDCLRKFSKCCFCTVGSLVDLMALLTSLQPLLSWDSNTYDISNKASVAGHSV